MCDREDMIRDTEETNARQTRQLRSQVEALEDELRVEREAEKVAVHVSARLASQERGWLVLYCVWIYCLFSTGRTAVCEWYLARKGADFASTYM